MPARRADRRSGAGATALALALLGMLASCAQMEPPLGGPEDVTPPYLLGTAPDSGAVGLGTVDRLEFLFSEKLTVMPAERLLQFFPPVDVAKSRWQGRRRLIVELQEPLPADTVVVVRLPAGYSDGHRVPAAAARTLVFATGDSLPDGRLRALVTLEGEPAAHASLELLGIPTDTLGAPPPEVLRRAAALDSSGVVTLDWLPVPGGPWNLRVFHDANRDGRVAENEPQRLWPGTWSLDGQKRVLDLGVLPLFKPGTPGRLLAPPPDAVWPATLLGWPEKLADDDAGFAPRHAGRPARGTVPVSSADTTVWSEAGPGLTRLILFADVDGDSVLSALPDSSAADTVLWTWEPFAVVDSLEIEPGRPLHFFLPGPPDSTRPCLTAPPRRGGTAPGDSLAAAPGDSLAAAFPDSAAPPPAPEPEEE